MARDTNKQTTSGTTEDDPLPNLITIVGSGVPSNYELSVDGIIEMDADNPVAEATIISERVAEGSIDTGVDRFRFSGQMANIRVVDWNGIEASESSSTPTIHIDYGVAER